MLMRLKSHYKWNIEYQFIFLNRDMRNYAGNCIITINSGKNYWVLALILDKLLHRREWDTF